MFFLYRTLTTLFFPILIVIIFTRKLLGKEDRKRYIEKIFILNNNLDKDNTIWFHGASIGEIMSAIPLIKNLIEKNNEVKILVTTVTLSSARIIEKKFKNNNRVTHQYFPLDVPFVVRKFLNIWKPKIVLFIDSEIWPNFLIEIKTRKIPLILLNGRITKKTFNRWKLFRNFSNKVFSSFDECLASSKESYENLKKLNVKNLKYIGNLKYISLEGKKQELKNETLKFLNKHQVWCAASTHDGEEEICINVHKLIKNYHDKLLTIIIPRHISRTQKIFILCKKYDLNVQILHNEEKINSETEVLIINSFNQMQKYYSYCKSVFIGKSLLSKLASVAGQNPIEAAKSGCKIYHGPFVYNFSEIYEYLNKSKVAEKIENSKELASKIIEDLKTDKNIDQEKINEINLYGKDILKETTNMIIRKL
ncbi:3-deoxy-D-manno-octulosonic acid transferase [Pelagibacteraceae bacterium]|nr:3-deoxy-D-manno-octulosonic acid transferase [Pelagibacteraceae bacterium]